MTITHGKATGDDGGGIHNAGTLTLNNVIVTANDADGAGGGIYSAYGSTLTIGSETEVSYNESESFGGGIRMHGGNLTVTGNSTVSYNETNAGTGGGIFSSSSSSVSVNIIDSTISYNEAATYGGGITGSGIQEINVTDSYIVGNVSSDSSYGGGGIYAHDTDVNVIGSVISCNSSNYGSGIRGYGTTEIDLVSSTIAFNEANSPGGGIYYGATGDLTAANSIISQNTAPSDPDICGGDPTGTNLIGSDPGFIRAPYTNGGDDYGDLRLNPNSEAINAGDNTLVPGTPGSPDFIDLDGKPRITYDDVDIGAYEYDGAILVSTEADGADDEDYTYGNLSLREALILASEHDGHDTITFDTTLVDEIVLTQGELVVDSNVTIEGPGTNLLTIDADTDDDDETSESRVFKVYDVTNALDVTISGMTITGGYVTGADDDGGGIYNAETLTLNNVTVTDNKAAGYGGGIYNHYGTITAQNSIISQNEASEGGGIYGFSGTVTLENGTDVSYNESTSFGGGIRMSSGTINVTDSSAVSNNTAAGPGGGIVVSSNGIINVTNSEVSNNTATCGGGLYSYNNTYSADRINVTNSVISGNTSSTIYGGGGIYSHGSGVNVSGSIVSDNSTTSTGGGITGINAATISIGDSTISDNHSTDHGGGIRLYSGCSLTVEDGSIISGNESTSGSGGGIYGSTNSTITFTNSIIAGNTADDDGGGIYGPADTTINLTNATIAGNYAGGSGGGVYYRGTLNSYNSIVALNEKAALVDDDIDGILPSTGDNLVGTRDGSPGFIIDPTPGTDNTWGTSDDVYGNIRLAPGSNAIDGGSNNAASGISYDSDGNARIFNSTVDIGAYEYQGEIVVTTLDDDDSNDPYNQYISLREALQHAYDHDWDGDDTIVFHESLGSSITLNGTQLTIDSDVTIEGAGLTINANDQSRVFKINSGVTASISDMTITGGDVTGVDDDGGGIYNAGTLTITDVTITDNDADGLGGGIYNHYGTITAQNSIISQNEASEGGGIYGFSGTVTLENGTDVSYNESTSFGGGIRMSSGTINVTDSSAVSNNTAAGPGGGIVVSSNGIINVTNSEVSNNTATCGGGLYSYNNTYSADRINVTNSVISGNTSSTIYGGGGIYSHGSGVNVSGSIVSDNSTTSTGGGITGINAATISIGDSTISDNHSTDHGGGIRLYSGCSLTVEDGSIISGNESTSGSGGGIYGSTNSTITFTNSIIAGNTADDDGGGIYGPADTTINLTNATIAGNYAGGSGGGVYYRGTLNSYNSIVALNEKAALVDDDIDGILPSTGDNLVGTRDGSPGFIIDPTPGTDNTWGTSDDVYGNIRLAPGSNAIDGGSNNAASGISYDSDGNARIFNSTVDIGAYEYQGEIVVTTLDDDDSSLTGTNDPYNRYISLREALAIAADWDSSSPAPDTITFQDGLQGTITLNGTELLIDSDVTIEGPGANLLTIDANTDGNDETSESRIFKVYDETNALNVTISNMTITGGYVTGADDDGGGIYNAETLTLNNVTITDNKAAGDGDGIYNDGTLTITSAVILDDITNDDDLVFAISSTQEYDGVIDGSGELTKSGSGILIFTGSNDYTGDTILSGGTLTFSNGSLPSGSLRDIIFVDDSTLQWASGNTQDISNQLQIADGKVATLDVGSNDVIFGSKIYSNGSGSLTKIGSGKLTLTGISTYEGATTINAGTLQLGYDGTDGSVSGDVVNNSTLIFETTSYLSFPHSISGFGTLTKTGTGYLALTRDNNYFGTTTISDGTLRLGATGHSASINSNSNIINNSALVFDNEDNFTYAGKISGSGSVTKDGDGVLTFINSNSYSGDTIIDGGTLQLGNGITNGSIVGNIDFDGSSSYDEGDLIFANAIAQAYHGAIIGNGTVTKTGSGTLTLTGNNTYTGATTLSGGTLSFDSGALGSSGDIIFADNSTLQWYGSNTDDISSRLEFDNDVAVALDIGNNNVDLVASTLPINGVGSLAKMGSGTLTLRNIPDNATTTVIAGVLQIGDNFSICGVEGDIAIVNNSALVFANSNNVTCSGVISGFGTLTKTGSGTLRITGGNTYDGITTISAGTLQLGDGTTNGSIVGDINNESALVFYTNNIDNLTYAGNISGNGSVTKDGSGVAILTGSSCYIGGTTIEGGTLQLGDEVTNGSVSGNIDLGGGSLVFANASDQAYNNVISGYGSVRKIGAGVLTLDSNNTYTGYTTLSAGTLSFTNGALGNSAYSITIDGVATLQWADGNQRDISSRLRIADNTTATLDVGINDVEFGSKIYSSGSYHLSQSLTKAGSGKLTLAGISDYQGVTTIDAGTLQLGTGSTNGSVSGDIANNSALIFANATDLTYTYSISGTGTLGKDGAGKLILTNNNASYCGTTTVSAGILQFGNNTNYGGLISHITIVNGAELIFYRSNDLTYSAVLNGDGTLRKMGNGKLTFTNDHTFFTGTTIISDGSLQLSDNTTSGSLISDIIIYSGAELIFYRSDKYIYPGTISGSGTLTKQGDETLTFINDFTSFTGNATIDNGYLHLTNTMGCDVTVQSGTTIYGAGTVEDLRVYETAWAMGTLATDYLRFYSDSTYVVLVNDTDSNQICADTVILENDVTLNAMGARANSDGDALVIIDNQGTSAVTGTFSGLSEGDTLWVGGLEYTISYIYDADTDTPGSGNDVALIDAPTALTGPTGLSVDASVPGSTQITWNTVSGATSYDVYRKKDGGGWFRIAYQITSINFTDSVPTDGEYSYGVVFRNSSDTSAMTQSESVLVLSNTGDYDDDDLSNLYEYQTSDTDPTKFDTDGDFLGDGWEVAYSLDPLDSDENENEVLDCYEDNDSDTVSNIEEFNNHTDPTEDDTDEDEVSDADEIDQGSDPLNPNDYDIPASDMKAQFTLTVGDNSGSESEWWAMRVGDDIQQVAPYYGMCGSGDYYLEAGESYDITLKHLDTDPDFLAIYEEPDYDWMASISGPLVHWIDDPYSIDSNDALYKLLQEYLGGNPGLPDMAEDKVAHLHIFKLDADVDSKNDDGFSEPQDNEEEDRIEQSSSTGKIIFASTGDIDEDGIVDSQDMLIDGGHFVPMTLSLSENIDETQPYQINLSFYSDDNTKLRIWKENAGTNRSSSDIITWSTNDKKHPIDASNLGLTPGGDSVTVYIEALASDTSPISVTVEADIYGAKWSGAVSDTVHVLTADIDLAMDGLGEAYEEEYGAFVRLNNDFSKNIEVGPGIMGPDYQIAYDESDFRFDDNFMNDCVYASVDWPQWMNAYYDFQLDFPETILVWDRTSGQAQQIDSGETLSPFGNHLDLWIEGIDCSTGLMVDSINVTAVPFFPAMGDAGGTDRVLFTVVEVNSAVDGNRDTEMQFDRKWDNDILFWYNNDLEGFDSELGVETDVVSSTSKDSDNDTIDTVRDLEDFAAYHVKIDPLFADIVFSQDSNPAEDEVAIEYYLELKNGAASAVNIFSQYGGTSSEANIHVTNTSAAQYQLSSDLYNQEVVPTLYTDGFAYGQKLPQELFSEGSYIPFIFEAIGETDVEATLVITASIIYPNNHRVNMSHEVTIDLRDISKFYDQYDVPYTDEQRMQVDFMHYADAQQTQTAEVNDQKFFDADDYILLVHGWNMSDPWKEIFAETAYKRLYWQGYEGSFGAFNWPTYNNGEGSRDWPGGDFWNFTYDPSELQAWRSGRALKNLFVDLGEHTTVLAHSMGNVVIAEALRQWTDDPSVPARPAVENYVAMEAAISAGAYGDNATDAIDPLSSETDLYRYWSHGYSDPSVTTDYYMHGTSGAAGKWINLYNQSDLATGTLWKANNMARLSSHWALGGAGVPNDIWEWRYDVDVPSDPSNNNTYERINWENGSTDITSGLTDANGRPGATAYEIMAFTGVANSMPVGTKPVGAFNTNTDISVWMGAHVDDRVGHSFQFHMDAATTRLFWKHIKDETDFTSTYEEE